MADKNKISIYETVTSKTDGKTTKSKTRRPRPGKAWTEKGAFWVRPAAPNGDFVWDNDRGWIGQAEKASQLTAGTDFNIPLAVIRSSTGAGSLSELFDKAWAAEKRGEEWGPDKFIVELKNTIWYKEKSEAQRKYYTLSRDPAQAADFNKQVAGSTAQVKAVAGLMGANLSDAQAQELAKTQMQNGLNDSELRSLISGYITFSGQTDQEKIGSLFGAAGEAEDDIRNWAKKNNVTVAEDWILNQVRGITSNSFDVNKSKDYITNIAKQQYSAWADKLDNFNSVEDLAAGYRQRIAAELDESIDKIDLKNPFVDKAMRATDDKGRPISDEAVVKDLRKTDQWASVIKNKDKIFSVANDVLSTFGMR
jgi:hypothetical protein